MAGITIDGGRFNFQHKTQQQSQHKDEKEVRVLILGNFSGPDKSPSFKPLRIDKDNIEEVFSALDVCLNLPGINEELKFKEFDDLHPDFLFERVALFGSYRVMLNKLKKAKTYEQALEIVGQSPSPTTASAQSTSKKEPQSNALLNFDELLQQEVAVDTSFNPKDLIQSIIRPYIEQKADPRIENVAESLQEAISETMRKIMHSPAFQSLESAWRGLMLLNNRLDTDRRCKLYIFDISKTQLSDDLQNGASQSQLYKKVVEQAQIPGAKSFDVILTDYSIEASEGDVALLQMLVEFASAAGANLLAEASPKLAGFDSWKQERPNTESAEGESISCEVSQAWQNLRSLPAAQNACLATPRYMCRLPYGQKTSPTETFQFEELPEEGAHEYYLWGNGAYLLALLYVQNHFTDFVNQVNDLPLHVYQDEDGDEVIKPCAEALLTDTQTQFIKEAGFTVLRSIKNQNAVLIDGWRSLKS